MPGKNGGARPGAGRKPGGKNRRTIEKELAREALRAIVMPQLEQMVRAQIAQACGLSFMVVRDKRSGAFVRVHEGRPARLKPTEELIEVWEKDPSTAAFKDLMDRALDKPKEQEQEIRATGDLQVVIERLTAARKRVAQRDA